jgi:hypothetical protein
LQLQWRLSLVPRSHRLAGQPWWPERGDGHEPGQRGVQRSVLLPGANDAADRIDTNASITIRHMQSRRLCFMLYR